MFPWTSVGDFRMPTFLLIQVFSACLLLVAAVRRARSANLEPRLALDLTILSLAAGLIGGRLLHVLWESPSYYLTDPRRVFDLFSGGYVYYGGFLFATAAGWIFLRWKRQEVAPWFDFAAPLLALGTAIGRLGCLFAGCCYGKVCYLPWAVSIVDENGLHLPRHPAPLYAFLWEISVLTILLAVEKDRRERLRAGFLFALWLILHGVGRFLLEFLRDDFRGRFLVGLSLSQWISLGLIAAGTAFLLRARPDAARA